MIEKTRAGTFTARIYHQGKQVSRRTFKKKGDARIWEESQQRSLKLGTWADPRLGATPVETVVEQFNSSRKGAVADHTWDTDEANLRLHVPATLRRKPISMVGHAELNALYIELLDAGKARATVSRIRNSLSSLFAWAVERDYLATNPVEKSKLPKGRGTETTDVRPFRSDDLRLLIAVARKKNALYADIIEFLGLTGLRWGEMKALTVGSIVQVPLPALIVERSKSDGYDEKSTKAGKSRKVPLVARAAEIVDSHSQGKARSEPLFRSARGKNLSGPNFTRTLGWSAIAPGHRLHDLRHTAATNRLIAGVDIKTVAAWLGHSDTAITLRIYTHYVPSHNDAAAINRLNEAAARDTSVKPNAPDSEPASEREGSESRTG